MFIIAVGIFKNYVVTKTILKFFSFIRFKINRFSVLLQSMSCDLNMLTLKQTNSLDKFLDVHCVSVYKHIRSN